MPTYEYVCKNCGEHLEAVQSFHDEALSICPRCGGDLKKVFGSVGIVFKGSGFYKNDSRNSTSSVTPPASPEPKSDAPAAATTTPAPSAGDSSTKAPAPSTPSAPTTTSE
jgi:putative FmdB family regulatory protein